MARLVCGVGVDLADPRRMSRWRARFLSDVLAVVFTAEELTAADRAPCPGVRLAVSLAGKEACGKALGRGMAGMAWTDVDVAARSGGAVVLTLSGAAAGHARRSGVRGWTGAWCLVTGPLVLVRVTAWNESREKPCPDTWRTTSSSPPRPS